MGLADGQAWEREYGWMNQRHTAPTVAPQQCGAAGDVAELVERLRVWDWGSDHGLYAEAATALIILSADRDRLAADLAEAVKVIEPFAEAADIKLCGEWEDHERFGQTDVGFHLNFGHLRAARAFIARRETSDGQ